ncbi:FAD-dependent oxidoreductase [Pseudomonas fluorescens]|uniref:FAD-dependent oxidoreductase n=1 Tax=Pseudomonas fluorescens TaxID=294 RepID=UPI001BE7E77A|nr:FAD-dependent monooxygenase [Pseudomonas fluorescens]
MKKIVGGHAVIIGGSIAGLVAARVLSEHFQRVTILERDLIDEGMACRKGTPGASHSHGLTSKGARALESIFPGIKNELKIAGSVVFDHAQGISSRVPSGQIPFSTVGQPMQFFTRPLLESLIRRRVIATPRVHLRDGTRVTGLRTDAAGEQIIGVNAMRHSAGDAKDIGMEQPISISADFVIDASGRFSRLTRWLRDMGYTVPDDHVVDAGVIYTTCIFKGPDREWEGIYHFSEAPHATRGAYVLRTEKKEWLVTLSGALRDKPPVNEQGFLEFAFSMNNADITELLKASTRVTSIVSYARTENRLRLYHLAPRWPQRLAVLGDAVCAFNPVYGQGMSMATFEAIALGELIGRRRARYGLDQVGKLFQARLARLIRWSWLLAISSDLMWEAEMRRTKAWWGARAFHWYKSKLYVAVLSDQYLLKVILAISHMERHALNLFHPVVMARMFYAVIQSQTKKKRSNILSRISIDPPKG